MMPQVEVDDVGLRGEESWVRHFMSSVGVLTTQVATPPIAPAIHGIQRLIGIVESGCGFGLRLGAKGGLEDRKSEVRLYDTNSKAFRAP